MPVDANCLYLDAKGLVLTLSAGRQFRLEPFAGNKAPGVAKAVGKAMGLTCLDAFAGFGQDTLGLANQYPLTLVEQNTTVALMLAERVADYMQTSLYRGASPMQLLHCDTFELFDRTASGAWDIVYLDPMFSKRGKGALPKLGMQILAALQTESPPIAIGPLVQAAKRIAARRVILKRRTKDPAVGSPDVSVPGSKVRFDIYLS